MSAKRRVFPETFKREAVDRVATSGLSVGRVATELGLHETVLRRWVMRPTWPPRTLVCAARMTGSGWSAIS